MAKAGVGSLACPLTVTLMARNAVGKTRKWSAHVTKHSHALALENKVFTQSSAKKIAASLKRSAEQSKVRKAGLCQSAMSMLNFYINRAGRRLSASRKKRLDGQKTNSASFMEENRRALCFDRICYKQHETHTGI